ncbi:MAG: acyl-CoA dehydrogenase, partial [bacterium]|nr:acyl-CoA dehydrogenase [bacterium]
MILLNPKHRDRPYRDARSDEIMRKTVEFFESKGRGRLLGDYYDRPWYSDFLEFVRKERIFASMCTPAGEGAAD